MRPCACVLASMCWDCVIGALVVAHTKAVSGHAHAPTRATSPHVNCMMQRRSPSPLTPKTCQRWRHPAWPRTSACSAGEAAWRRAAARGQVRGAAPRANQPRSLHAQCATHEHIRTVTSPQREAFCSLPGPRTSPPHRARRPAALPVRPQHCQRAWRGVWRVAAVRRGHVEPGRAGRGGGCCAGAALQPVHGSDLPGPGQRPV